MDGGAQLGSRRFIMRLHIKNGRVIDPSHGIDMIAEVCIADGLLVAVGAVPAGFVADRVLEATGKLVLPGLVDLSARVTTSDFNSLQSIENEMCAALAGGVTSMVLEPDLNLLLDTPEQVSKLKERTRAQHPLNVYPLGAMTMGLAGQGLTEMVGLTEAGCVAFSQGNTPVFDTRMLLSAMQYAKTFDYALWLRPQDAWLSQGGVVASGAYASRLGLPAIPVEAETVALQTLLSLQRVTGVRLHLCRLSSASAITMVRQAKKEGLPITCDVAANHVHLTDVDIGFYDSNFLLEPPLRGQRDRDAIRLGLQDGTIDAICSAHVPVTAQHKQVAFANAMPGSTGLELLLSLTFKWAQEARVPLLDALKLVTSGPGQVLGSSTSLLAQPGCLALGASADVCLVDPDEYWMVNRANLVGHSEQTPFVDRELPGRVCATVLRGQVVWERIQ